MLSAHWLKIGKDFMSLLDECRMFDESKLNFDDAFTHVNHNNAFIGLTTTLPS